MVIDRPLKDSGRRVQFTTGAMRDIQDNKPRPELMNPMVDMRLSMHFGKGAAKYEERNWEKGIPEDRYVAAAKRHMNQWLMGEDDEDHLIAWLWNVYCLVATEEMIERGILPETLRNLPNYRDRNRAIILKAHPAEPGAVEKSAKAFADMMDRAKAAASLEKTVLDGLKALERSNRRKRSPKKTYKPHR
jgi:hypothetical protein